MKRIGLAVLVGICSLSITLSMAWAQALSGATVEERAINGAKA